VGGIHRKKSAKRISMDEKNQNLIELAKKKRYIALVEKLGRGSLGPKELKELEEFEKVEQAKETGVIDGTVDLGTISVYLEKSSRMVRRYVSQGMPVIRDSSGELSRFKVNDVFKWVYGNKGKDTEDKDYWENEYRKNRAKLSELELKQKEGELIPFADHVSIVKNQIRGIRAGLLRLPKHVAPKLYQQDPKLICEMLDQEIRYIINQFAGVKGNDKADKRGA
jgi:phage terminase Nu1 subunit (DNA packaging protein)